MSSDADLEVAQAISRDPALRECLFLIKRGVPFDVAFSLDAIERLGWVIACGELDGGVFDWSAMKWSSRE